MEHRFAEVVTELGFARADQLIRQLRAGLAQSLTAPEALSWTDHHPRHPPHCRGHERRWNTSRTAASVVIRHSITDTAGTCGMGSPNRTYLNAGRGESRYAANMATDALQISHEEADGHGASHRTRGPQRLADDVQPRRRHQVIIDHTAVHPKLRGLGVARRLLDTAVAWARATGTRVMATCPYAKAQFEKDPSIRDVYDS